MKTSIKAKFIHRGKKAYILKYRVAALLILYNIEMSEQQNTMQCRSDQNYLFTEWLKIILSKKKNCCQNTQKKSSKLKSNYRNSNIVYSFALCFMNLSVTRSIILKSNGLNKLNLKMRAVHYGHKDGRKKKFAFKKRTAV